DYYASGIAGVLGYLGADKTTLADWKAATGKDSNSVSGDPKFISPTDLHIDPTQSSPVGNAGFYITSVPDDIDGNTRNNPPDIGADEYMSAPVAPVLLSPANNSTGISLTPALDWDSVSSASVYHVQVSLDSTFATTVINDSVNAPATIYNVGSGKLSPLTKYYWRVDASNIVGTSPWSTVWNFTTLYDPTLLTQINFNSVILPQYLSCGGTTRLPYVYRATITNLQPNKTYRFYNQSALYTDFNTTNAGAGNPMFIKPDSSVYRYTTSTSLTTAGGYSQFVTDGSGNYTGWFSNVNTANARFTAGNYIIPTITLGDSVGTLVCRYALNDSIKVINFSTNTADTCGTGIYGISTGIPMNIVALYDNVAGTGRPLSQTYLESEGITVASVVAFYATNVNGQNGRWGTVIPNVNANGVQRVEQRSLYTGDILSYNTDSNGVWPSGANTVNPTGGLTPVALLMNDAPLIGVPVLVAPSNGALNQPQNVLLDWNPVNLASVYKVQVASDSLFGNIIRDTTSAVDSIMITNLPNDAWYWWRIAAGTVSGFGLNSEEWKFKVYTTGINNYTAEIPKEFKLYDNFPNPFNPTTKIRFDVPKSTFVKITIYDITGREIQRLVNNNFEPGAYEYQFNASGLASGMYFYRIEAGDFKAVKKMVLIK
ncbi:MAG: T9SS type A sorting domain-containing protein, partial [Ignavibacteria bacterium]|nr:T9SS type A sorting domain-containing protein [Ignavibacteria bacterium]